MEGRSGAKDPRRHTDIQRSGEHSPSHPACLDRQRESKCSSSTTVHRRNGKHHPKMGETDPRVHLLNVPEDGVGTAYVAGFKYALFGNYDFVFEMDADFSHTRRRSRSFLKSGGCGSGCGSRYTNGVRVLNWRSETPPELDCEYLDAVDDRAAPQRRHGRVQMLPDCRSPGIDLDKHPLERVCVPD